MAFYSATLFTDAKASERSALLFSWGFGLINFAQVNACVHVVFSAEAYSRQLCLACGTHNRYVWAPCSAACHFSEHGLDSAGCCVLLQDTNYQPRTSTCPCSFRVLVLGLLFAR